MNLAVLRDRIREYNNCPNWEEAEGLYRDILLDLAKMSASAHPNTSLLANEFIATAKH